MKRKTTVTLKLRVEIDTEAWEDEHGTATGTETTEMIEDDAQDAVRYAFNRSKWHGLATVGILTMDTVTMLADGITPVVALWQCEADGKCGPHPVGPDGKPRDAVALYDVAVSTLPKSLRG